MGHDYLIYVTKLLGTANEVVQKTPCQGVKCATKNKGSKKGPRRARMPRIKKSLQRTIDVSWVIRNFTMEHFSTGVVPALAQGIIEEKLEIQSLFALRFCA